MFFRKKRSPPIQRIAVAMPPAYWFHGINRQLAELHRDALRRLGCTVFEVPIEAFLPPDHARIGRLSDDLRRFRPQLTIALCTGNHAVVCRLPPGRDGWRRNFFTEELRCPTVFLWDHSPLDLADQILSPHPAEPSVSKNGAIEVLRRSLNDPLVIHFSRDSWQTQLMAELGLAGSRDIPLVGSPALPGFEARQSAAVHSQYTSSVAFIGHFYQDEQISRHPALAAFATDCIAEWLTKPGEALWTVLDQRIAALPASQRAEFALDRDQSYFWHFAHRLIVHQAQTASRIMLLGAIDAPIACYGDLKSDGVPIARHVQLIPGNIPFGPALARVFARHPITIDVLAPPWVNGYSYKSILGFSAGGFVLTNRHKDFLDAFGDVGEAVSYRDAEELGQKVDHYLAHPSQRNELASEMRARIEKNHSLEQFLLRILQTAAARLIELDRDNVAAAVHEIPHHQHRVIADLVEGITSLAHWTGANAVHTRGAVHITTNQRAWDYSAILEIPATIETMNEPELLLNLGVTRGCIGICIVRNDTDEIVVEHAVSITRRPIEVVLELPKGYPVSVVFRKTNDEDTSVVITKAALCDRA